MTRNSPCTTDDARKAIIIDFEGIKSEGEDKNPLPILLGTHGPWEGRRLQYRAFLIKPVLAPIARARTLTGQPRRATLVEALEQICDLAESKGLKIAYYSDHERKVIKKHAPSCYERFRVLSVNVIPLARPLCRTMGMTRPFSLERVITCLRPRGARISIPPEGGPAAVCRKIEEYARRTKRWGNWTELQKGLVNELLRYNREDCIGTRRVLISCCYRGGN